MQPYAGFPVPVSGIPTQTGPSVISINDLSNAVGFYVFALTDC